MTLLGKLSAYFKELGSC